MFFRVLLNSCSSCEAEVGLEVGLRVWLGVGRGPEELGWAVVIPGSSWLVSGWDCLLVAEVWQSESREAD